MDRSNTSCICTVERGVPVLVPPSQPTPYRVLPLASINVLAGLSTLTSTHVLVFECKKGKTAAKPAQVIRQSLGKVLVPYYPLAGTLRTNEAGLVEVECDGKGAIFVEARADKTLPELITIDKRHWAEQLEAIARHDVEQREVTTTDTFRRAADMQQLQVDKLHRAADMQQLQVDKLHRAADVQQLQVDKLQREAPPKVIPRHDVQRREATTMDKLHKAAEMQQLQEDELHRAAPPKVIPRHDLQQREATTIDTIHKAAEVQQLQVDSFQRPAPPKVVPRHDLQKREATTIDTLHKAAEVQQFQVDTLQRPAPPKVVPRHDLQQREVTTMDTLRKEADVQQLQVDKLHRVADVQQLHVDTLHRAADVQQRQVDKLHREADLQHLRVTRMDTLQKKAEDVQHLRATTMDTFQKKAEDVQHLQVTTMEKVQKPTDVKPLEVPAVDSVKFKDSPALVVQVTELACGGFVLSVRLCQGLCDAAGFLQFLNGWAEMARGVHSVSVFPVWGKEIARPAFQFRPFRVHFPSLNLVRSHDPSRCRHEKPDPRLFAALTQLDVPFEAVVSLRKHLLTVEKCKCNAFEALAAHVWRERVRAFQIPLNKEVRLFFLADACYETQENLPIGYYGMYTFNCQAITTARELLERPLSYAVQLIQATKLGLEKNFTACCENFTEMHCPCGYAPAEILLFTEISKVNKRELDFGWGKPARLDAVKLPTQVNLAALAHRSNDYDSLHILMNNVPLAAVEKLKYHIRDIPVYCKDSKM